jgi:hypothetical protein
MSEKSNFHQWMTANKSVAGLLALAIYVPGQPVIIKNCGGSGEDGYDNAWRAVAEVIPVLQLNDFPTGCFRFIFENALVHCERREDGVCVGVFARHGQTRLAPTQLDRILAEFHAIDGAGAVPEASAAA